jgi:hypothetical protein
MKPLKVGEYDLVNISLLGFDPVTGRSYEECHDEWSDERKRLQERVNRLRWWDLLERFRVARQIWIMQQRLGMS